MGVSYDGGRKEKHPGGTEHRGEPGSGERKTFLL